VACGGPIAIQIYPPMQGRACRFCLCLQNGSVFADFDVDPDGYVFAVRVSFDGYGACRAPADIARMTARDSATLLAMIEEGVIEDVAEPILREYFRRTRDVIWNDALEEHGLV